MLITLPMSSLKKCAPSNTLMWFYFAKRGRKLHTSPWNANRITTATELKQVCWLTLPPVYCEKSIVQALAMIYNFSTLKMENLWLRAWILSMLVVYDANWLQKGYDNVSLYLRTWRIAKEHSNAFTAVSFSNQWAEHFFQMLLSSCTSPWNYLLT